MALQNVIMPQMGESIQEGTLTRWHKKPGDRVAQEEVLFEISTDKVDSEIPSPASGILTEVLVKEGQTVQVNTVVAVIESDSSVAQTEVPPPAPPSAAHSAASSAESVSSSPKVFASPLARKVAKEHDVDLTTLQGSGEGQKIVKNDVIAALSSLAGQTTSGLVAAAARSAAAPVATASTAHVQGTGGTADGILVDGVRVRRVPMTPMRKKIAEHMVASKHTSPHVTSVIEIDVQRIVDLRARFKDKFEATHGFKLTFMPFFLHAVVEAVKAVPIANASVDGDSILYKQDINLGCAVALDWGLIVPVIKQASEKSFVGLGRALNNLAEKARTKKLSPEDLKGGTISITNYGGFGTVIGQPIINQPQVAIFGIGAMQKKPVVINDAIAIRTMCYTVLSFDHRVLDGSDSGRFLSTVKNTLENWNLPVI